MITPDEALRIRQGMAESRVCDLIPGDAVEIPGTGDRAIFVAQTTHPLWTSLRLVVWKLPGGTWSHDALDSRQVVGVVRAATMVDRKARLREALLEEGS